MNVVRICSDRWQGEIPLYTPTFCDAWQPPSFWLEEIGVPAAASTLPQSRYWRNGSREMVPVMIT